MNYGFVKVAAAVPEVHVADPKYNVQQIESLVIQAEGRGVEIICLPELSLTGYSCGDLFSQQLLLDEAELALIAEKCREYGVRRDNGLPLRHGKNRRRRC